MYEYEFHSRRYLPLVLVRRCSAHATASHAQDCRDRNLEDPSFLGLQHKPVSIAEIVPFSLVLVERYSAYAPAFTRTRQSQLEAGENPPFL